MPHTVRSPKVNRVLYSDSLSDSLVYWTRRHTIEQILRMTLRAFRVIHCVAADQTSTAILSKRTLLKGLCLLSGAFPNYLMTVLPT